MDPTKQMYVMCVDGMEWEDIIVYILTEDEVVEMSKKWPNARLERFVPGVGGAYAPTYRYYRNGVHHEQ